MTLSQHSQKLYVRTLSFSVAFGLAALTIVSPSIAQASSGGSYYQVELRETSKKDRKIIRGSMIKCSNTNCRGKKANSNKAAMCAKIASTFGAVKSFSAGGEAFDESQLNKCNTKA